MENSRESQQSSRRQSQQSQQSQQQQQQQQHQQQQQQRQIANSEDRERSILLSELLRTLNENNPQIINISSVQSSSSEQPLQISSFNNILQRISNPHQQNSQQGQQSSSQRQQLPQLQMAISQNNFHQQNRNRAQYQQQQQQQQREQNQQVIELDLLIVDSSDDIDNIKCPICHNIFINPIACANCLNHFCGGCIRYWLSMNNNRGQSCPLCKNYKEMRCVPLLKSLLSKLRFRCSHSKNGCQQEIEYDNYLKHQTQCGYQTVTCSSEGCGQQLKKQDLESHINNECEFVLSECQYCQLKFKKRDFQPHVEDCLYQPVECEQCHTQLIKKDLVEHNQQCPELQKKCSWCNEMVKQKNLEDHMDTCDKRIIKCIGCGYECYLFNFLQHQASCPLFPVLCTRCNKYYKRVEYEQHNIDKCIENIRSEFQREVKSLQDENKNLKQRIHTLEDKETKIQFSTYHKDIDIFVKRGGQVALVREYKKKRRDRFVLADLPQNLKDEPFAWKFKILSLRSEWFAVGITDSSNIYSQRRYHDTGHMSYLISANGILYSSHSVQENWQHRPFQIEQEDEILCVYHPQSSSLLFKVINKDQQLKIDIDMDMIRQNEFYPCSCLRCPSDSVQISNFDGDLRQIIQDYIHINQGQENEIQQQALQNNNNNQQGIQVQQQQQQNFILEQNEGMQVEDDDREIEQIQAQQDINQEQNNNRGQSQTSIVANQNEE